jgi:hypothetical protein
VTKRSDLSNNGCPRKQASCNVAQRVGVPNVERNQRDYRKCIFASDIGGVAEDIEQLLTAIAVPEHANVSREDERRRSVEEVRQLEREEFPKIATALLKPRVDFHGALFVARDQPVKQKHECSSDVEQIRSRQSQLRIQRKDRVIDSNWLGDLRVQRPGVWTVLEPWTPVSARTAYERVGVRYEMKPNIRTKAVVMRIKPN